jgi:hypothetical protein
MLKLSELDDELVDYGVTGVIVGLFTACAVNAWKVAWTIRFTSRVGLSPLNVKLPGREPQEAANIASKKMIITNSNFRILLSTSELNLQAAFLDGCYQQGTLSCFQMIRHIDDDAFQTGAAPSIK